MSAEQLALVGSRLVKRCGTRDPFEIAADIGVEVKAEGEALISTVLFDNTSEVIHDRVSV